MLFFFISFSFSTTIDRFGTIFEDETLEVLIKCRSSLETYNVPKNTIKISDGNVNENAFGAHCYQLHNVTFENGCLLENIGKYSFYCSTLQNIDLRSCRYLKVISEFAFLECRSLTKILLSDSIETIGNQALRSTSITSIKFPVNLTSVSHALCYFCRNLSEVIFDPECKTTSIQAESFLETKLEYIKIPRLVSSLSGAFLFCPLKEIEIDPLNEHYHVINNIVYTKDNKTLVMSTKYPGIVKTLSSTVTVGQHALRSCEAISIQLNYGLKEILGFCMGQSNLTSLSIPYTVSLIQSSAFFATYLLNIDFNCSITVINSNLFRNCFFLEKIVIPSYVTEILDKAFYNCRSLIYIKIPSSVQRIAGGCFSGVNKSCQFDIDEAAGVKIVNQALYSKDGIELKSYIGESENDFIVEKGTEIIGSLSLSSLSFSSLTFPTSVYCIKESALLNTKINSRLDLSMIHSLENEALKGSNVSQVVLGNELESIPEMCFSDCINLRRISIPCLVSSISKLAFDGCGNLGLVDFVDSVLSSIGDQAFRGTAIKSIEFPKTISKLGYKILEKSEVEEIRFHSDCQMTNLSSYAIAGCLNLTVFSFPKKLEVIGEYCFEGDISMISIGLSDKIKIVKAHAFSGCTKLQTVRIGDFSELETIEGMAFEGCISLSSFWISEENQNFIFEDDALFNGNKTRIIVYLTGSKKKSFEVPNTISSIGAFAFYGAQNLISVEIKEGCQYIGAEAFKSCQQLSKLSLPSSLVDVGASVFTDCPLLTCGSVEFPLNFDFDILRDSDLPTDAYKKCATTLFSLGESYNSKIWYINFEIMINNDFS